MKYPKSGLRKRTIKERQMTWKDEAVLPLESQNTEEGIDLTWDESTKSFTRVTSLGSDENAPPVSDKKESEKKEQDHVLSPAFFEWLGGLSSSHQIDSYSRDEPRNQESSVHLHSEAINNILTAISFMLSSRSYEGDVPSESPVLVPSEASVFAEDPTLFPSEYMGEITLELPDFVGGHISLPP